MWKFENLHSEEGPSVAFSKGFHLIADPHADAFPLPDFIPGGDDTIHWLVPDNWLSKPGECWRINLLHTEWEMIILAR